jgi:hypothetical protein
MPSDERLSEEKARLDAQRSSGARTQLRRKLQEIETASRAERWITSKDSQPPK